MPSNRYRLEDFWDGERFYRIPKALFLNPIYKDMSNEAKLYYAVFRGRFELSLKNKWVDKDRIYLLKVKEVSECVDTSLIPCHGIKHNGTVDDHGMEPNDTEKIIKNTPNGLESSFQESFLFFYDRQFLTEKITQLLLNFGDTMITKKFLDIIFQSKKKVENYQNKENRSDTGIEYRIYGDIWSEQIEN